MAETDDADAFAHRRVPRSLSIWLEEEILKLENKNENVKQGNDMEQDADAMPDAGRELLDSIPYGRHPHHHQLSHDTGEKMIDVISRAITYPWIGFSKELSLPNFVLFSEATVPSIEKHPQEHEEMHGPSPSWTCHRQLVGEDPLRAIPKHVGDFLLENYISRTVPSYPIFHESWLRDSHAAVIGTAGLDHGQVPVATPYQVYVISLVMATSLSTAARSKQVQANKMAFSLFQHATQYIGEVLTNDLAGLQALALLHTYAVMNPAAANVYFLAGFMMQACIDLGLHREDEDPDGAVHDYLARDMKRRLFWSAWEMDASCNAGLSRSPTLLPHQITTGFPSDLADSAIHRTHLDPTGQPSKFICGKVRTFRLIECEIISTLFHGQPLAESFATLAEWMADVEDRIHAWRSQIHASSAANQDSSLSAQWMEMSLFADIADPLIIVTLYRPCPKVKYPTVTNLIKAFKAAIKVGEGYSQQAQMDFGSPKYTFQPCYHVFSSAIVFLHTIRQCESVLASLFTLDDMTEFMLTFSRFFSLIAERWPAALKCLHEYHRLLEPVKERYTAFVLHLQSNSNSNANTNSNNNLRSATGTLDTNINTNTNTTIFDTSTNSAIFDFTPGYSPNESTAYVNSLFESMENANSTDFLDMRDIVDFDWTEDFDFEFDVDS
ncbi:hypothetical protein A1O3_05933 [Capronia epimyces CBS 606.96]|uniref:Xylanolytic transcriptional activator regulatory domain-containing protein n=1 Tax=Capronia epimyces CBS 606.96 TaxID=1182542 RepID=W9XYC1_9EURO|nr:uncharacterized protein A1O3_05933 [Capronia epimyces CBS 606.96]EXJ85258.1 hypothetical protein A1O3_05933 [Capronia epimyces CBS 606.96]